MAADILLLIGPKGSGKSTLGRMLEVFAGVHFLEAEPIAAQVLARLGGVIDENYAIHAFAAIAAEAQRLGQARRAIVLETTGASAHTGHFIASLRAHHRVHLIRVRATVETCATRIAERDPSGQIAVPVALIQKMQAISDGFELDWDLEVNNDPALSPDALQRAFASLVARLPGLPRS